MGKAPATQFYWNDWLSDVELQSSCSATRGVWMNALCRMWFSNVKGELSGTRETLPRILNCTLNEFEVFWSEAQTLGFCYTSQEPNGTLIIRNRRMWKNAKEQEFNRLRQKRFYEKHKDNGGSNGISNGDITPPSSSSSSSSKTHTPSPNAKNDDLFEAFWRNYPRKQGKGAARKAWKKIKAPSEVIEKMKEVLPRQKSSDQWTKENGRFIPMPATYLNQGRWEDEIIDFEPDENR